MYRHYLAQDPLLRYARLCDSIEHCRQLLYIVDVEVLTSCVGSEEGPDDLFPLYMVSRAWHTEAGSKGKWVGLGWAGVTLVSAPMQAVRRLTCSVLRSPG